MIAGHRRKRACELAGIETIPVIVKNVSRNDAERLMIESNLHFQTNKALNKELDTRMM